ncbi:hypothetical protein MASR2M18_12920 [Ignavibacteria bacterium]|nr:BamA/TamA family outer membrane protein [Bacteroidota bacterium]MCZ2132384.1 BamA/TamA family outer membrane protein [Bacteroidota bacterium]
MNKLKIIYFLIGVLFLIIPCFAYSQITVRNIYVDRKPVFDSTSKDWFFAGDIANWLHSSTRDYVIDDELLFSEDDELLDDDAEETERNLRRTGLFADAKVRVDTINDREADIYISVKDRWSTFLAPIYDIGGGASTFGGFFKEMNVAGTGSAFSAAIASRSENNIGMQGDAQLYIRRIFRSEINLYARVFAHRFRTIQELQIEKPFRTLSTKWGYGAAGYNHFGSDFLYGGNKPLLTPFHEKRIAAWGGLGVKRKDRLFFTVSASAGEAQRLSPSLRRAFDNSGKLLLGFSSLSQKYERTVGLNGYETEDVPIGAWGTAVLGKTFALGDKGEGMYYAGGQVEQSARIKDAYLYGSVAGGSGFLQGGAQYTYQEFTGLAHYRISDNLLVAGRLRQQTAWNWNAFRQLVLDNDAGLRGYAANKLTGANRIIGNVEMRWYPDIQFWIFKLSGAAFYDAGSVWNAGTTLGGAQFHNAIGAGLRIHNLKASGPDAVIRVDFAYNADEKRFGGIILSAGQMFSIYAAPVFRAPQIFGLDLDDE